MAGRKVSQSQSVADYLVERQGQSVELAEIETALNLTAPQVRRAIARLSRESKLAVALSSGPSGQSVAADYDQTATQGVRRAYQIAEGG